MERDSVVILDFGSQYTQLIARRLRELQVYSEILPPNTPLRALARRAPRGIVLSGGPDSVYDKRAPKCDPALYELGVPVLAICYGMQLMAHQLGGQVRKLGRGEYGHARFEPRGTSALLGSLPKSLSVWMSHGDSIQKAPEGFSVIGASETNPIAAMESAERRLYGILFHPEVKHTADGATVLSNFLDVCGCKRDWNATSFIEDSVARMREQIGGGRVICALSGGVDSAVTALLVHRAVGSRLTSVFVDNGLLRKDEAKQVRERFAKRLKLKVVFADATDTFMRKLKGVSDPERKRKVIGREFIEVFKRAKRKIGKVDFLAQGTLYPDVIESTSVKGPSVVIKSHHNVGGLPKSLKFKLVEPLRELFKDEVRKVGLELGLDEEFVYRQPFPGPGLAVRCLGALTRERLDLLREADHVVAQEIKAAGLYRSIWQSFAVLLPVKSVGVMGDYRTYQYTIAIRAVESADGMTADWARLPHELLARISNRIVNEVRGINRVVYDISSKPPSTIEWEWRDFVHLHLHTEYSLLDGATHLDELVERAKELKMRAVGITDHGNMFGAVAFHDLCRDNGLKPILGCEIYVAPGSRFEKTMAGREEPYNHLTLLSTSDAGYHNLIKLVSMGYTEGFYYRPRIDKDILAKHSEGLIGLSGCLAGEVAGYLQNGLEDAALQSAGQFSEIFGKDRFYLELMDHGIELQRRVNRGLLKLREKSGLPLVATNDSHYLRKDDHQAHDVLLCIGSGKKVHEPERLKFDTQEFYLKSGDEMAALFPDHLDALDSTVAIAEMCDFTLKEVSSLPAFDVPPGFTIESYFEKVTRDGFEERRRQLVPLSQAGRLRYPLPVYEQRLDKEIAVIRRVGFAGYFLIVWDFIRYAREQRIPVGPGRGSAAGSLVAYSLRITDIDPIEHDLIFERFLNEERISPPDIDIDFCENRRGEVIDYVTRKYGRENVAQIITFGTMKAKAVVRDVARVMDLPYADADKIAKMIPFDLKMTLDKALLESPPLQEAYQRDPKVKELIDISRRLEGTTRHASTHAAGVVIAPRPLTEFVPLFKGTTADITTQYDMKGVERIGLLKMDFLGLRTLTLIDDCVKMIEAGTGLRIDPAAFPIDDTKTYELFTVGKTSGLFQFESDGMRDILRRFKPDRLEHLTALNALYRPGPMQMIDDFIRRRHGQTKVSYEAPALEPILQGTYGIMVYQEQVMQIASALAGYTLGEADILRKAMGKKNAEVMATQKQKFLDGCQARQVNERKAQKIWDHMEQFAGYGFNKSHSAAYAWLAYQTGYLKANHPAYFVAALLTSERANTEELVGYIEEAREMGIEVLPPDVNESRMFFAVVPGLQEGDPSRIRFGLAAIKNVGEGAVEAILHARKDGPFRSLFEFCERVDSKAVNRRVVESFVKSGCFDSLTKRRASLFAALDGALDAGAKRQRDREQGQASLFGLLGAPGGAGSGTAAPHDRLPEVPDWGEGERLAFEKESLGFFVSGHPLERFRAELQQWANASTASILELKEAREVSLGGIITALRLIKTKKGDRMASFVLEDLEGTAEALVFPETYKKIAARLADDQVVLVKAKAEPVDEAKPRLIVSDLLPLEEAKLSEARYVTIRLPLALWDRAKGERLKEILDGHRGEIPVTLELDRPGSFSVAVAASAYFRVRPDPRFREEIEALLGPAALVLSRSNGAPRAAS